MIIQYGDVVDPITFRAADVSEPLVRRSPSNVARPSSPMIVASPASLRFAKHDRTHDQLSVATWLFPGELHTASLVFHLVAIIQAG